MLKHRQEKLAKGERVEYDFSAICISGMNCFKRYTN
jgi:hypothetical protein